jgi:hypothetical protein
MQDRGDGMYAWEIFLGNDSTLISTLLPTLQLQQHFADWICYRLEWIRDEI